MQTEQKFLQNYRLSDYPRPSVTADIAAFTVNSRAEGSYRRDPAHALSLLLIRRGGHPFLGHWALPGGFLQPGETVETCALREATEETHLTPVSLLPVGLFSAPGRDPRGWVISSAYACVVSAGAAEAAGGDDAAEAAWFDVDFAPAADGCSCLTLTHGETCIRATVRETGRAFGRRSYAVVDSGLLAFDHAAIIAAALSALRSAGQEITFLFDFLPETFTLAALQKVQETVSGAPVLPANFRRKVAAYVEETEEMTAGAGHRPARLYRRKLQP